MADMNGFLFVTNVCILLLCGTLMSIAPRLTRQSFLFGVKVPPEAQKSPEAKALRRSYTAVAILGSLVLLVAAVVQYSVLPDCTIYTLLFSPLAIMAVQLLAFAPQHRKALQLKSSLGWHVPETRYADTQSAFTRGNLSAMPHFWYILSLAVVFASFVLSLLRYPSLPETLPTHWNFQMVADGWSSKSPGTVLLTPIIAFAMVVLLWFTGLFLERAKLQIDHMEPARSFAQHRKYRRLLGHSIGFMTFSFSILFFLLGLQTLYVGFALPMWLTMTIVAAGCIPACVIAIGAGQAGTRLKVDAAEISRGRHENLAHHPSREDAHWLWGLFYHNPEDPAYFVGDRFGGSIGFNYARLPVKIGVTIAIVLLIAAYIWMIALFRSMV